jgi:hypothetical protein
MVLSISCSSNSDILESDMGMAVPNRLKKKEVEKLRPMTSERSY